MTDKTVYPTLIAIRAFDCNDLRRIETCSFWLSGRFSRNRTSKRPSQIAFPPLTRKNEPIHISFHDGFWIGFHAASWLLSSIRKFACPVDIPQSLQHASLFGLENDWPDYALASEPINRGSILTRLHGRMPGGHPSSLFDGSAARMARKQTSKTSGKVAKEKLQLTLCPDTALKLRLAALASRMDLSELVTSLITKEFSGLHIRGFDKTSEPQAGAGQGSLAVAPSVSIKGVSNRINDIARGSTLPRDEAIDSFMSE